MNRDIDEIKSRLNIEDIVSEYIKLKKTGSGLIALCPFHSEKSPSFNVSPDRGFFKCFGCGESGDIFSFVQKIESIDFPQTLKKLAEKSGVVLQNFSKKSLEEIKKLEKEIKGKERLLTLLEETTLFFHSNLLKNENAKKYLKKRGIDEKMAKKFRLGFALDQWNSLENFLLEKNFSKEEILEVGLTKKNNQEKIYDRFRNRIIFPIFDEHDNPIAFSGRDFSDLDNVAKYLNSPQTIFFDKSDVLFGLNFAKIEAIKRKYFILVEGQMDLVMSHKAGFENTVASSGTSLTDKHLKNLSKFSKNLIFAFDSDKAGIEAAFRGIKKALAWNFDVKILDIPTNFDPADIILESQKKWAEVVKNSKNIIEFYIKKIIESDKNLKEKISDMEEKILPFVAEIKNPIEKGNYISKISRGFDIKEDFVLNAIEFAKNKNILKQQEEEKRHFFLNKNVDIFLKDNIIEKNKKNIFKQLTAIYYWQKSLDKSKLWINPKKILNKIKKHTSVDVFEKILKLEFNKNYIDSLIFEVEMLYNNKEKHSLEFDIEDIEKRLSEILINEKISILQKKINSCDENQKMRFLKEIQDLTKKKNDS